MKFSMEGSHPKSVHLTDRSAERDSLIRRFSEWRIAWTAVDAVDAWMDPDELRQRILAAKELPGMDAALMEKAEAVATARSRTIQEALEALQPSMIIVEYGAARHAKVMALANELSAAVSGESVTGGVVGGVGREQFHRVPRPHQHPPPLQRAPRGCLPSRSYRDSLHGRVWRWQLGWCSGGGPPPPR